MPTFFNPILQQIIDCLTDRDMTRDELLEVIDLPRTTLYDYLQLLESAGKIESESEFYRETFVRKKGRPRVFFKLKRDEHVNKTKKNN